MMEMGQERSVEHDVRIDDFTEGAQVQHVPIMCRASSLSATHTYVRVKSAHKC